MVELPQTSGPLALIVALVWVMVFRSLLVFANKLPPTCHRCSRRLERRYLGEQVCECGR
jgi:hypothetical protein